jgi:hypothetical protein
MSPEEWRAAPWHDQQMYLEGLLDDPTVPFSNEEDQGELPGSAQGPTIRENVDAGTDVIDLTAMREGFEAERRRRSEGGGP